MRVLVTGGAGFIGSHLVEALLEAGHQVRVLDNFYSGRRENLRAMRTDVEVLEGDCNDASAARRAVRGIETVFHEAAVPSVARSVANPELSHRANATATLMMLLAARDAGVRRFIYASSSSIYGDVKAPRKHEGLTPQPMSPYAVGKLIGEHYLRVFHRLYGLETLSIRYFNVFGPRQDANSPYSGVISLFTTRLLSGRTPTIFGDGKQSRDFTFVSNVVRGNLLALKLKKAEGQAVNVATGRSVNLQDVLKTLNKLLSSSIKPEYGPLRPGDIRHSLADIRLARRVLGYRPQVSFEEGIAQTLAWYRQAQRAAK